MLQAKTSFYPNLPRVLHILTLDHFDPCLGAILEVAPTRSLMWSDGYLKVCILNYIPVALV